MNIFSTFLQAVENHPDATALIQDGQSISYGELKNGVLATAGFYQSRGIEKGDMVLVFVPISLDLYSAVLALFYLGASPVFLDEWVSTSRLKECLKVVDCKAIIAKPAYLFLSAFIGPLRRIPVKISTGHTATPQTVISPVEVCGDATALVTFTTGSSGIPKAANRTHAYLFAQLKALSPLLNDIASPCMTMLPIVVLLHLAAGKTAMLAPRRFKASKPGTIGYLGRAIADQQPEALIASPAVLSMLIQHSTTSTDPALLSVFKGIKSVITGGGPVYPNLAVQMLRSFPVAAISAVYGSTEAEPISHISAKELSETSLETLRLKGLPVGFPDISAEVAILDMNAKSKEIIDSHTFKRSLQPPNIPGEVIVAGPHVLKHYIGNPLAEAKTKLHIDAKVWHRTGDCGILDEKGKIYLLGSCSEIIVWKGKPYYPAIISYCLELLAGVKNSALLLMDNIPILVLEDNSKILLPLIKSSLSELQLADAGIRFIDRIPKDPRHQTKVDYAKLKKILGAS